MLPPSFFPQRVVACYSIYNEVDLIESSILSILPYVDHLVVLDGPYTEYPSDYGWSTDGTLCVLTALQKRFPNFIEVHRVGRMDQNDKRSLFPRYTKEGDLLFIIDGDELAFGDVRKGMLKAKHPNPEVGWVQVLHWRGALDWRPRFIRWTPHLRYEGWFRAYADQRLLWNLKKDYAPGPRIGDFRLVNLGRPSTTGYRSREREEAGQICKEKLLAKLHERHEAGQNE